MSMLTLGLPGLAYADLFTTNGLQRLDGEFLKRLNQRDAWQRRTATGEVIHGSSEHARGEPAHA